MVDNCDDQSTIGDDDVSVSDMNDEDNGNGERGGSSKSNSITSGGSVGISASSQGSSTNSLPVPPPGDVHGGISGMDVQTDPQMMPAQNYPSPFPPNAFHRQLSQQATGVRNSAKLSNPNSSRRMAAAGLAVATDDGTIDPKNFATIRTTSIVQRQQK